MSNQHAPARSEKPVVAPVAAGPKFVEVEVKRKIGLEFVPDENGEMVRWSGAVAKVALAGEIVKITAEAAAKLLKVGAVVPTAHTFD